MVKDKINYRATGPRTQLTKQTVGGRANDGGLRVGEMERDTIISHGISDFLRESMMERGDKYYVAICNKSGLISIYNPAKKLFMSPMADGPLKYVGSLENEDLRLEHVTKFGRSFSIICVPYTFKLLVQELQSMNVQMRIITEDNIDQIENMSYSDNITQLTGKTHTGYILRAIRDIMNKKLEKNILTPDENDFTPDSPDYDPNSPDYAPTSPNYDPRAITYPRNEVYDPDSPPYSAILGRVMTREEFEAAQNNKDSPLYAPTSPEYAPQTPSTSPGYIPRTPSTSPGYVPNSPDYDPNSPPYAPSDTQEGGGESRYNVGERVCLRNCKDNYPTRPWKVSHVGPKFITVSALDPTGLDDSETMNVVTPFDIYPEEQAHIQYPNIPLQQSTPVMTQPMPMVPQQQPTVVIAPKFFNGNGSDNSSDSRPAADNMPIDNFLNSTEPPGIVVKNNVKESQSISDKPKNDDIDFSNIVIKKAGI